MQHYLPQGWTLINGKLEYFYDPCLDTVQEDSQYASYDWAISSAVRQASQYIREGFGQLIANSGCNAERVAKSLGDDVYVQQKFDIVIHISTSQYDHNVEEVKRVIEKRIKGHPGASIPFMSKGLQKHPNFLLILDLIDREIFDLQKLSIPLDHGIIVLSTQSQDIYQTIAVDVEIKMEYHLLPWQLFCKNVNQSDHFSSAFKEVSIPLLDKFHSHLPAIILLARALKDVKIDAWESALHELMLARLCVKKTNRVMDCVLEFVWKPKSTTIKKCIKHYKAYEKGKNTNMDLMISFWLSDGLIKRKEEGEIIVEDLIGSFLIEHSQGNLHMQEEIKYALTESILPSFDSQMMESELAQSDTISMNLDNSELTKLPEIPECSHLKALFLNNNPDLMKISPSFFEHMPMLQVLDLSYTSIMTLPSSISELVSLKKLFLRCCELLMELPPEIGKLTHLQVFDLDGTEIVYLPKEMEHLTSLEQLKLCFYGYEKSFRKSKQISERYPRGTLSKLTKLEELSIDVNPDDEEWIYDVEDIIYDLQKIETLRSVKLYLPKVELLGRFAPSSFKFIVGQHEQRLISRIPEEVEEEFTKHDKSLRYINGENISAIPVDTLRHTRAFFLDRHWTVKRLSEFGIGNLAELKLCLLTECNELETILDEVEFHKENLYHELQFDERLGALEYLGLHYLRNLTSICRGPISIRSLSKLKYLSLRTCTNLTYVFTLDLLKNLEYLEELILEDCPKIKSLVSKESPSTESNHLLPSLKKMSLLELPELVNLTDGISIAPRLERLVVFYCPKLEKISSKEVSCRHLKVLKGENEWWESLTWNEWSSDEAENLANVFVPLRRDGALKAQFTKDDF